MKILVTGGRGFIGSNLIASLLDNSHEVFSISHNHNQDSDSPNEIVGDFQNEELLDKVLPGMDYVIHLACSSVPENSVLYPDQDVGINVLGSLVLMKKMKEHQVKKIIYVSSGGVVYGNTPNLPIVESEKLYPVSSYGITKMMVEQNIQLLAESYGISYCILRISNAYGEGQHQRKNQGIINIWLDRIIRNQPIDIIDDGSQVRDYIHISDIVNAFNLILKKDITGTYNLGTGTGTSLLQLKQIIENVMGKKATVRTVTNRKFDVKSNVLNAHKFSSVSGWKSSKSLEEGIRELILSQLKL